jgi:hypothetical protein
MFRASRRIALGVALLALLSAGCGSGEKVSNATTTSSAAGGPAIQIVQPAANARIGGNVVDLELQATGITIVKADGDTTGKTGHIHVFVDRDPVAPGATIPKEAGVIHTTETRVRVAGLTTGRHTLTAVLGDGAHSRIGTAAASLTVELTGPSVQATAPATVPAGQAVPLEITVTGVDIVAADGDTSGRTGHLHVFVDRDPLAPGAVIPKEAGIIHTTSTHVDVPDLTPGEHTLWVMVGDGAHQALSPAVLAKVTVTIS